VSAPTRHIAIHGHGFRLADGHAFQHQFLRLACPQQRVGAGQIHPRVDAQHFGGVLEEQGLHLMPFATQDADDVREVVFPGRVIRPDFGKVAPQQIGTETIDAGIDFVDRQFGGAGGFLFDDGENAALLVADHASVAGRIFQARGDDGGRRVRGLLLGDQPQERGRRQQGAISVEHG
jgi:hypothetical protein